MSTLSQHVTLRNLNSVTLVLLTRFSKTLLSVKQCNWHVKKPVEKSPFDHLCILPKHILSIVESNIQGLYRYHQCQVQYRESLSNTAMSRTVKRTFGPRSLESCSMPRTMKYTMGQGVNFSSIAMRLI